MENLENLQQLKKPDSWKPTIIPAFLIDLSSVISIKHLLDRWLAPLHNIYPGLWILDYIMSVNSFDEK